MPNKNRSLFSLLLMIGILITPDLSALPEFADQENRDCVFCHIDPDGGGARNRVGQIFEENYFSFPDDFDPGSIVEEIQKIRLSGNVRTAYIKNTDVNSERSDRASCISCHSSVDAFFLMKSEIAVHADVSDRVGVTISNNFGGTLDAFGQIEIIDDRLRAKIGQFQIPFAIRQNDHNNLVRQGNDLGSNKRDLGIEITGNYKNLFFNSAIFNGDRQTFFESNQHKGFLATIGGKISSIRFGISHLIDKPSKTVEAITASFVTANFGNLSINAEYDLKTKNSFGDLISNGYFFDLKYRFTPKLWIAANYESFDPDLDKKGDLARRIVGTLRYKFDPNGSFEIYYWGYFENRDQIILMSSFWF